MHLMGYFFDMANFVMKHGVISLIAALLTGLCFCSAQAQGHYSSGEAEIECPY